ncbi:unnamed protein product [Lathyrus sativus]|nr:unnamed protein product [Lathyrus sativus]
MDKAVETPFKAGSSSDPSPEVQSLDIEVNDDTFKGLTFVVLSDGKWFKNSGSDFCIEFGRKKQIQKATLYEIVIIGSPKSTYIG